MPTLILTNRLVPDGPAAHIPASWSSRALYLGSLGTENWLRVVGESNYPLRDPRCFQLHAHRLEALQQCSIGSLVSLGPGDGQSDVHLLTSLQDAGMPFENYVPVEISRQMLELAIQNVQAHASISIGVQCDFEGEQDFLFEKLSTYASRPIVFSLMGGTIGNLDAGVQPFFSGFRSFMKVGDAFMIDLPLVGPGWTVDVEPRLRYESYTVAFRHFLAGGAGRIRELGSQHQLEEIADCFLNDLESQIQLQHHSGTDSHAEVITVTDRTTGRVLLTFRRYRWQLMLDWFRDQGFEVAFAKSSLQSDDDKFGMGVVLLKLA